MHYAIVRDDSAVTVAPADTTVTKFLTNKEKKMVTQGWKRMTVHEDVPFYSIDPATPDICLTYQGIWRSLKEHLESKGHTVSITDMRKAFPVPKLTAMRGLRFSQQPLLTQAIMAGCSGLIGAPTRFGKTFLIINMCRVYGAYNIVVTAPGVDLVKQLYRDIKDNVGARDVSVICTGSRGSFSKNGITVCSMDSLHKCDANDTDLLLIDEPHACVTDSRIPKIVAFHKARKIGFGATLKGRYDKRDKLIEAIIGPVIANRTYTEAVAEGAISPLKVIFLKVKFRAESVTAGTYDNVVKQMLTTSTRLGKAVEKVNALVPDDWQTMLFIRDEKQADFFMQFLPEDSAIAMAKKLKVKERDELTARLYDGEVCRCLASKIYIQGVTFPELRVLVNLAGGGANTGAIQKPGRLLQIAPGKNYGIMVDIMFECENPEDDTRKNPLYKAMIGESWARHKAYEEIGYDVMVTDDVNKLTELVKGAYDE